MKNKNNRKRNKTIGKRYSILSVGIGVLMLLLLISLFQIQVVETKKYQNLVEQLQNPVLEGDSAPRGRIYDRNYRLIVDNKPVKVIAYKRKSGVSRSEEVRLAYLLGSMIEVNFSRLSTRNLKEFWLQNHYEEGLSKITEEEWKDYSYRKLDVDDIEELKLERVTEEELSIYKEEDKEAAYIYYLMRNGYSYQDKVIKNVDVTDLEYAVVNEKSEELKGFFTKLDWERIYPYGNVMRTLLGSVSSSEMGIPKEFKEEYLKKGYELNDRVGLNYLEYQYEDYLKGEKDQYVLDDNGEKILIKEGSRGKDLVLTIDIELQKAVEEILIEQMKLAKQEPNTEYYNHAYVIIEEPNTGEILAMAGKEILKIDGEYKIYDAGPGIVTDPIVVGSAVKGASHIVGYNNGGLKIGEVRSDACIKIATIPKKCSLHYHGMIDDIEALKYSSNTYQYQTAIGVGGSHYTYNMFLNLNENAFSIYRNTFEEFGLGVKTGIDLPIESAGYIGEGVDPSLLLDFAIGQYDAYTPMQLSQYISTIATSGKKMRPHLLKEVYYPKEELADLFFEVRPTLLGTVHTDPIYMERVQLGFQEVLKYGGTGSGLIDLSHKPAGKTGTSETFLDTDGDGFIDLETVSNTFVAYAPYDHPKVTFTIVSPNVSHFGNRSYYLSYANRKISREVARKFFEISE